MAAKITFLTRLFYIKKKLRCTVYSCWAASFSIIVSVGGMAIMPSWRSYAQEGYGMHTYCLFCETAKCRSVANAVMQKVPCRAIYPKQVQHTRSQGKMVDIEHDLLPGYVFLYLEDAPLDIALLRSIQGIIRCLSSQDKQYELTGNDEQFALMLLQKNGVIGKTKVYQEGQMICICKGAYEGVETKILKVNKRNMRMQIEIPFAGMPVKTWVEYEIVQDAETSKEF